MATLSPVALQLYSVREAAAHDFRGTVERVAGLGVVGVEYADLHGNDPATVRRWTTDLGLVGVAAHRRLPSVDAADATLDEVAALGIDRLVVPWVDEERVRDTDAITAFADDLAALADRAAPRGITIGFHNHWFEMARMPDGRTALEHLFEATHPSVIAEVDMYWAQVAGVDPAALVTALGDRVRMLHVKDGPADGRTSPHVPAGQGAIDIAAVVAASPAADWHIVEFDACATDVFDAIGTSVRWLVDNGLSRGRQ